MIDPAVSPGQALLARRIEESALNAWPALQHMLFDGWILRFSQGHTKRANSVNPLYESYLDLETKIDACEARYADQGLPPIFRLPSITAPPALDALLAERGYRQESYSLVQSRALGAVPLADGPPGITLRDESLDEWLAVYCHLRGDSLARHAAHRAILAAIPARCWLVTLEAAGSVVACGVGVIEHDFVGLYDLFTHPARRGQGYATALVAGLLRRARDLGADYAYLQVEAANGPARHLYEHTFGFETLYHYWYRVPGQ